MRLHFSIGCYDCRGNTRFRQGVHFSILQVLFANHMHRRSGVDNKFSFLRFKSWCRQTPIFRKWEECCFVFLFNLWTLLANFHAASRAHRSCHSVSSWDRSSNFRSLGPRWWGSPGQISPSERFWFLRDVQRLLWILHVGWSVSGCLSSSVKSMKTSTAPYSGKRNPIIVYLMSRMQRVPPFYRYDSCFFNIATALLSPIFLDFLLRCSSTWRCA